MHAYGNVMHTSTYLQIIVNIPFKEESLQLIINVICWALCTRVGQKCLGTTSLCIACKKCPTKSKFVTQK